MLFVPGLALEVNGATRWVNLGLFTFQPSEFLKFALIIYLAVLLSERRRTNRLNNMSETVVPLLAITAFIGVLVAILQKDLGTMVAIASIIVTMLFVSGIKFRFLARFLGIIASASILGIVLFPHRISRILAFLNPNRDVEGIGYQINQALITIGSGGWLGKGLGKSVQVFGYLPEAINDSIFAIIGEEFGFIGAMAVIILYSVLLLRMVRIIERSPNDYLRLMVAGAFGWMSAHVVINIGAMINVLPLTGITLPFLSFGGTSLIFLSATMGLVYNASRYTSLAYVNQEKYRENITSRRRQRRAYFAAHSTRRRA